MQGAIKTQLRFGNFNPNHGQGGDVEIRVKRLPVGRIIGHAQINGLHGCSLTAHRQKSWRAVGVCNAACDVDEGRPTLLIKRHFALKISGLRGNAKVRDLHRAIAFQQRIDPQPHIGAKEFPVARGKQRCDVASNIRLNAPIWRCGCLTRGLRANGDIPCQTLLPVRCNTHVRSKGINRATALHAHLNHWRTG